MQDGSDVVDLDEEKLRKKLRKGDLSGAELARRAGDTEWKPLHTFPVFKEEVPFEGGSAAAARRRLIVPLLWHVGVFVAMGTFVLGWPWWMLFWGAGVAAHTVTAVRKIFSLGQQARALSSSAAKDDAARSPVAAAEPVVSDALHAELVSAFAALEKAAAGRTDMDIAGTKKDAMALQTRRAALMPLCDAATRERLDKEQDRIMAEEERSPPELKEILRQQALALQQRLDAMDESQAMVTRLEARLRTVLHQVENLRMQLARAGVEEGAPLSLSDDVRRMQREIAADAEAEAAVRTMGPKRQPT